MSRPASRKAARETLQKASPDREPVSRETGLREWLEGLPRAKGAEAAAAAAFDTRLLKKGLFPTGAAARGIASALKRHGYRMAANPEGFIVTGTGGPLLERERERARAWGRRVANTLAEAWTH